MFLDVSFCRSAQFGSYTLLCLRQRLRYRRLAGLGSCSLALDSMADRSDHAADLMSFLMSTSTAMPAAPLRLSTEETASLTPRNFSSGLSPSPGPATQSKEAHQDTRRPATPQFSSGLAMRTGSTSSLCTTPKRAQSLPLDFASPDSSQKPKISENLAAKIDAVGKQLEEQLSLRGTKNKSGKAAATPKKPTSKRQVKHKASAKKKPSKKHGSSNSTRKPKQEPESSQVPGHWDEGEEEELAEDDKSVEPGPEKDTTFCPLKPRFFPGISLVDTL